MSEVVKRLKTTLELDIDGMRISVRDAGRLLQSLERRFGETGRAVERIEGHMSSLSTRFRHFVMTLGMARFALMDLHDIFLSLPSQILKTSGEIERMTQVMAGLSRATDDTGKRLDAMKGKDFIFQLAKNAPFEVKSIQDAFIKLKAGGLDPMDGSLKTLIDGIAKFGGTSETLHRASVAIQQMSGKGVISMEELRQQLGEAMPLAMQYMASGAGMSMAELTKHISRGSVQSREALQRMFFVMELETRGAAAEMMDTWTGMVSRLGTEWTLLQEKIAASGFAEEAKRILGELIDIMGRRETLAAMRDIGQTLGGVVVMIAETVKWFIQMWDYIKLVGEALIVYMVGSKIIERWNQLSGAIGGVRGAYASAGEAARQMNVAHGEALRMNAALEATRVRDEVKNNTAILVERRAHLRQLQMEQAAAVADMRAQASLQTPMIGSAGRQGGMLDINGRVATAAEVQYNNMLVQSMKEKARALDVNIDAERRAIESLEKHNALILNGSREQIAHAKAIAGAAEKMTFLDKAARAGSVALGMVGGPIGLITLALTIGIPIWFEYANAAEKAMKRVRDAVNNRTSSVDDARTMDKMLFEKREELRQAEAAAVLFERNRVKGQAPLEDEKDNARRVTLLRAEIADLERLRRVAETQVAENDAERQLDLLGRNASKALQIKESALRKEIADDRAATQKLIEEQGLNQQASDAAWEAFEKRSAEKRFAFTKARFNELIADKAKLQGKLLVEDNTANAIVLQRQLEAIDKEISEADLRMQKADRFRKKMNVTEKPQKDPLTVALEKARGELDESSARLEDLQDGVISFTSIYEATLAKMMGRARAGGFNGKDAKGDVVPFLNENGTIPNSRIEQFDQLVYLIAKEEENNRVRQVATQLLRADASEAERARLAHERLANAGEREGTEFTRVSRALEVLKSRIGDADVQKLLNGKTLEEFVGSVKSKAAAADFNNFVADLQRKNGSLRASLYDTEREQREAAFKAEIQQIQAAYQLRKENVLKTVTDQVEANAQIERGHAEFLEHMRLLYAKHARDMESPMQRLARQWSNTADQMREATAQWARGATDAIVQFTRTGKLNWESLADQIINDLIRIQVQKGITGPLGIGLEKFFGLGLGGSSSTPNGIAGTGGPTLGDGVNFAKGGIMTSFGEMALRKYAAGGIASSPQLAVFGEGSMNEAYVPLPDGRRIPVAMQGGAPNVQVNVINQTGLPVTARQGQPRFDGKQAILDVVLTAAQQPGPFRDTLKGAVG